MRKGVYIIRAQPFTKSHRAVAEFINLEQDIEEVVIVKGGSQWSDKNPSPVEHPSRNPFSAEECLDMINLSLIGRLNKPFRLIKIPDTGTKSSDLLWREWVGLIISALGRDIVVFTNVRREKMAFENADCECRAFAVSEYFRATFIREIIASKLKQEWLKYIDLEVADYIEKINGPSRIRALL